MAVGESSCSSVGIVRSWRTLSHRGYRRLQGRLVLGEHFDGTTIDDAWSAYPRSQVGRDDVLDAFAVLVAAERIAAGVARRVPASAVYDSAGIDMAIWF